MRESISFRESKIRDVVKVIRAGLKAVKVDDSLREGLEEQCVELEAYADRLEEE